MSASAPPPTSAGAGSAADDLQARLARFRAARQAMGPGPEATPARRSRPAPGTLAGRLAELLDGWVERSEHGMLVRVEPPPRRIPLDRELLADMPGGPPADAPLVCLDTETTGLGTATGTLAFLVGLGWWEDDDRFMQAQLLIGDHADEPALLAALAAAIPAGSWLVTYNGRTFDWPLLETRYRLRRHEPPPLAGHVDLLPLARRLFRHRLDDARLRSVETGVLGIRRSRDVEGWQIPGLYLGALRGEDPTSLAQVVRHNDVDVRSLAALLAHLGTSLLDPAGRAGAPAGDLAGLGRLYRRSGRMDEALELVEAAIATYDEPARDPFGRDPEIVPDGARVPSRPLLRHVPPWDLVRLRSEQARLLRRAGRDLEAEQAWLAAATAAGGSRSAVHAWIEVAKCRERALGDLPGALEAALRAGRLLERTRALGRPEPLLEARTGARVERLRRRLSRAASGRGSARPRPRPATPAMSEAGRRRPDAPGRRPGRDPRPRAMP
jgi:tetratricopeptide (TPR) repeat protein